MISVKIPTLILANWLALLAASAQTVTLNFPIVTPAITPENNPDFFATVSGHDGDSSFSDEFVGIRNFIVSDQSGLPANYPTQIGLFCMELAQDFNACSTGYVYTVEGLQFGSSGIGSGLSADIRLVGIGSERAVNLELLYAHVFGVTYNTSILATLTEKEGFQLAVWKLSQDDGFNLTEPGNTSPSKGFWITGSGPLTDVGALGQAQTYLNWVENNPNGPLMPLDALHSTTDQDLIIPSSSVFTQVPENPLYALILGMTAFGFTFQRRRAKRS